MWRGVCAMKFLELFGYRRTPPVEQHVAAEAFSASTHRIPTLTETSSLKVPGLGTPGRSIVSAKSEHEYLVTPSIYSNKSAASSASSFKLETIPTKDLKNLTDEQWKILDRKIAVKRAKLHQREVDQKDEGLALQHRADARDTDRLKVQKKAVTVAKVAVGVTAVLGTAGIVASQIKK